MPLETTYHAINLVTTAFFCGAFALLFGFAWGWESAQDQQRKEISMVEVKIVKNHGYENAEVVMVVESDTAETAVKKLTKLGFFQHSETLFFSGDQPDVWAVLPESVPVA
jgi:hypothetical protein